MFVGERMSLPVISVPPDIPIIDALNLMRREHIRRAPVVKDGRLIGINIREGSAQRFSLGSNYLERLGAQLFIKQDHRPRDHDQWGNIIAFGIFTGEDITNRKATFKVTGVDVEQMISIITPIVEKVIDIRYC